MINSMTGFGEADCEVDGISYAVEIKTVNNRYFKSNIKLPDMVAFVEEEIEKLLRNHLSRGTVNYTLRLRNVAAKAMFDIDQTALKRCVERLAEISGGLTADYTIDLAALLALPGIVQPVLPDEQEALRIREVILNISQKAIDQLKQMRTREGTTIVNDLKLHSDTIRQRLEQIRGRSPKVIDEYHKRLKKRLEELTSHAQLKLDEDTLAREVAIFAERCDISEELSRIESHLTQFLLSGDSAEQSGRRLDFISQELLREANTIGSKAMDADIARWVVDIKCLIDRIKEQVQNVE
ncbi:MAG: YicC/YloC family endoribonuclease [Sedimentisphaerales bacterium]|nr:YicC/YloC family endoribonuclease [Sedimentisphaerales bacterium]